MIATAVALCVSKRVPYTVSCTIFRFLAIPRWSFRRYLFAPSARVTLKGMLKSKVACVASV